MGNALTGDFEAVLQLSGGTINRLLASMHQNAGVNPNLPSFPPVIWIRIGDDRAIDGVRGTVQTQISVPHIELINGATDRFILEVQIRAWYKPDASTTPLPAFIRGTVRAEYHFEDIDPKCLGWSQRAADYLWIRVNPDTVQFQGDAEEDRGLLLSPIDPASDAANKARITKQIAVQLATRFEATPHPVSKHFRRGSLRSLTSPGASAVVMPLGISGEPVGQVTSINSLLIGGSDFAVAISRDSILALAAPTVAAIQGFNPTVHVHVSTPWPAPDIDTVYRVGISPPTVDWLAQGSYAVIKIKASGSAKTDSILPNADFDVEQDIILNFDAGSESLWLSAGSRRVTTHSSGLGSGEVADAVNGAVDKAVKSLVATACAQAQPSLDNMIQRKQELIDQLRTIDDHADAHFNNASFDPDGIVLSGIITLVGRKSPVISFDKTIAQDGYSALLSWFPGGWINRFDWTWSWSGRNDPGAANYQNRFVLRRPPGQMGRWGGAVSLTQPLPGIDGAGSVCLRVEGVQVDSVTGALVPVTSTRLCHQFGLRIGMTVSQAAVRPLSRQVPNRPRKPQPEQALAVRGDPLSGAASNTLVLYVDSSWDQETALALKGALEISPGRDKALTLLVLFKEGLPDVSEARIAAEVEAVGHSLGVPTVVNEDVRGGWAGALVVPAGSVGHSWRLMAPGGGVTWMHQGRISAHELAAALDHYLIPSQPSKPTSLHPTVAIGMRISPAALVPDLGIQQAHCPPPPIRRIGTAGSVVAFVQADSPASRSHLRALSAQYRESGKNGPTLVAVLDGGDAELARRIKKDLGFDASVLPDPIGKVADRFGVRIWPTTLTLDRIGTVAGVEVGIRDIGRDPQPSNSVSSVAQEDAGD